MAQSTPRFFRLFAQILITASALSLGYTIWMIYQHIIIQPQSTTSSRQQSPITKPSQ